MIKRMKRVNPSINHLPLIKKKAVQHMKDYAELPIVYQPASYSTDRNDHLFSSTQPSVDVAFPDDLNGSFHCGLLDRQNLCQIHKGGTFETEQNSTTCGINFSHKRAIKAGSSTPNKRQKHAVHCVKESTETEISPPNFKLRGKLLSYSKKFDQMSSANIAFDSILKENMVTKNENSFVPVGFGTRSDPLSPSKDCYSHMKVTDVKDLKLDPQTIRDNIVCCEDFQSTCTGVEDHGDLQSSSQKFANEAQMAIGTDELDDSDQFSDPPFPLTQMYQEKEFANQDIEQVSDDQWTPLELDRETLNTLSIPGQTKDLHEETVEEMKGIKESRRLSFQI